MIYESNNNCIQKYVMIFDLDETIGQFSQLYIFWNLVKTYLNDIQIKDIVFFKLLDKFTDFLRPNILKLLHNLKRKKEKSI